MNLHEQAAYVVAALSRILQRTGRSAAVLISTHPDVPGVCIETFGEEQKATELLGRVNQIFNPDGTLSESVTLPATITPPARMEQMLKPSRN